MTEAVEIQQNGSAQSGQEEQPDTRALLVLAEGVTKKYCRKLHRSLRYGFADLLRESIGRPAHQSIRPEEFYAIQDIGFEVKKGDCVAVLGPNGAGKTTLLKLMNGLLKPTAGRIRMRGRVAALTQLGAGFNAVLSGRENIFINSAVLGFSRRDTEEIIDQIIEFSEIGEAVDDPIKTYSSGMRARLGFSIAVFVRPDILLMDEVLATGDRGFRLKCFAHLEWLSKQGTSVIVVSHAVGQLTRFCNRALVLDKGELVFNGSIRGGIEKYEDILKIRQIYGDNIDDDEDSEPIAPAKPKNAPDAWVDAIQMLDHDGEPIESARHGQAIRIRIDVKSRIPTENLGLIAVVSNETGVISTMRCKAGLVDLTNSATQLELSFPRLNLNQGVYFVAIRLIGKNTADHKHERQFVLKVVSGKRQGIMRLDHKWSSVEPTEVP